MIFARKCPFCGERPEVFPENPEVEGTCWGEVACVNERCPAQPVVRDTAVQSDERGSQAYKALAIKVWNRSIRRHR